ncbi:hypothetical protein [Mucilaginibacter sp. L3T2-6]|uniref:hypothetical protein n=1 Tax=Mucilaginibacter sp. L3T2-6 TaxID=3062491 RepID=UPI0026751AD9|nr:hypothetical protein [Mucilaginibacter sp. L3T2-6]MDO3640594.1 hypothetical protein [Mucilaginibacter sp. L3T2-6]MDV6213067.1 hypothetical protein [Mucilaginibacter sp. L3T2-6]
MKSSTERIVIRWLHILLSIPVIGYIYGPVAKLHYASLAVKWVFFPIIVISGLWLWKGHRVKKCFNRYRP